MSRFIIQGAPFQTVLRDEQNPGIPNHAAYVLPSVESDVWYENRDGHHATAIGFTNVIQESEERTGWGINLSRSYRNGIVLSNSSTANEPEERWGSNPRWADTQPQHWPMIRHQWKKGLIQFFPEHKDYDVKDWFKVNQPYLVTTQGSSGSEIDLMRRLHEMLQVMQPEVRQWLIDNARVGDVCTYLMRSNQQWDYLNPMCHRVVVGQKPLNQSDLDLASSLTIDTLPPKLEIRVISDSLTDSICKLPEAVALQRVDATQIRTIVVELICDKPNAVLHWIKCQGDCVITYQNPQKSLATITIPMHGYISVEKPDATTIESNRFELIAIAEHGSRYSSPVYITEYFTPFAREQRTRMNEILVHADDQFVARINGIEVLRGADWRTPFRRSVAFHPESNEIEIEVVNTGGPGGLLCGVWVGEELHVTDSTWQVSIDRRNWVSPVVTQHAGSPWAGQLPNMPASFAEKNAAWIWHPNAGNSSVYLRKIVGTVVPDPNPTPPGVIAECIADLEAVLSKLRGIA